MEFRVDLSEIVNHILALAIYHAFIHRPLRDILSTQRNNIDVQRTNQRANQRTNQRQRHYCQRRRMQ